MDSFLRRLKYYGIGFGIGLVFVLIFFQNRGCSWLPSNRVKNSVLERVLVVSEDQQAAMQRMKISSKDIIAALNDGDVDFGESVKSSDANPKVYAVDKSFEGRGDIRFYFTLPSESYITEVNISAKKASEVKNTSEGKGKILRFPNEKNLLFVDSSKVLLCQQQQMGLSETSKLFKSWKSSARIDFAKTNFKLTPKAEHYIEFKDKNGKMIGSRSIWYKNKINISSFELPYETDCGN
jgi:hypothetical protein